MNTDILDYSNVTRGTKAVITVLITAKHTVRQQLFFMEPSFGRHFYTSIDDVQSQLPCCKQQSYANAIHPIRSHVSKCLKGIKRSIELTHYTRFCKNTVQ